MELDRAVVATSSAFDIEIETEEDSDSWVGLMLSVPRNDAGQMVEGAPKTLQDVLAASDADSPISKRLVPLISDDWSGGVGLSYNQARCVYTRSPGYAIPAGAVHEIVVPATNTSDSPIVAFEEFSGGLWFAQTGDGTANTARVCVSSDGTGVGAGAFTNSLNLGANEYMRDLLVFTDDVNGPQMWAASSSSTNASGRLHRWTGAAWVSTAAALFGTWGRNRMAKVYWSGQDGVGASRMVVVSSGSGHISYLRPGTDPMLAASWVEGVRTGTSIGLNELVAAPRHVYCLARDGCFDLNELGESPNITPYTAKMLHLTNGQCGAIIGENLYTGLGQGCDKIYIGQPGLMQGTPGQCAPGLGTSAENEWRGWPTAMAVDQGYLVYAMRAPTTGKVAVFWGKPREELGIESPNPMIWYGPEIVGEENTNITRMRITSDPTALDQSAIKLWLSTWNVGQSDPPKLVWVSLPVSGAPLQDLLAAGNHRYATGSGSGDWQQTSRLHLLAETAGDKVAVKILHAHGLATRGLDVATSTKLTVETRADALPNQTTWTTTRDVTISPKEEWIADDVVSGNRIERRVSFVSPSGGATPPKIGVLDAFRTTAWRVAPAFGVKRIRVEFGLGILDLHGVPDDRKPSRDPDTIMATLKTITESPRTRLRDRNGKLWLGKLEQVRDTVETLHEGGAFNKTCRVDLEFSIVAGPL
jgi:hypothetical protein